MLAIPKLLASSLAPGAGLEGARILGAPWIVLSGLAAAAMSVLYTYQVTTARGDFGAAFGADWPERIPAHLKPGMLTRRWAWRHRSVPGVHVERDVPFATVPGTDRTLLADIWSPPANIPASGVGFIYLHGGGYTAFDKGGPTAFWFRHLAAQGHVVMDVSYRLIPETTMPGMQGDVKRALVWLKRNADRYGVDPNHVVLGGGSAGSHLALLAAHAPDHPLFTPEDVRGADLSVHGVIGYYNAGDYRPESKVGVTPHGMGAACSQALDPLARKVDRFGNCRGRYRGLESAAVPRRSTRSVAGALPADLADCPCWG